MNRKVWTTACRWMAWSSGSAVAVLSCLLIGDGLLEKGRAASEKERVEILEARVPTEAVAADELAKETEIQTLRSVEREARNLRLGLALLIAVAVFLTAAKSYQGLQYSRQPSLVSIGSAPRSIPAPAAEPRIRTETPGPEDKAIDLGFVDEVVKTAGRDREAAIPILQSLQTHYRYLPEEALRRVCEKTEIEPAQIIGVASFYSQFRRQPVGRHLVRVCHGTACHVAGIEHIMDELRRRLDLPPDADTDPLRRFTLESVNCLGCCSLAPVMMVEEHVAGRLTPTTAWEELASSEAEA